MTGGHRSQTACQMLLCRLSSADVQSSGSTLCRRHPLQPPHLLQYPLHSAHWNHHVSNTSGSARQFLSTLLASPYTWQACTCAKHMLNIKMPVDYIRRQALPVKVRGVLHCRASNADSSSRRCWASMASASGCAVLKKAWSKSSTSSTKLPKRLLGAYASFQPTSASHLYIENVTQ